jgi:Domain of unknown function (DUF4386)
MRRESKKCRAVTAKLGGGPRRSSRYTVALGRCSKLVQHSCNQGSEHELDRNPGRVAGLWYLVLVVLGPLRLIYIPSKLFVHANASATVSNVAGHEWLFRLGVLSDQACAVVLIFLVLAFYRCVVLLRHFLVGCRARSRDPQCH